MLVYDLVDPQELLGFVRSLEFSQFTLNQFLPDNNIEDIEYRFRRGNLTDQDAATYRAWDTEAPIASRQGVQRVSGELPPISRKISVGEEERHRLRILETGNTDPLINQIFDDAANMTRAVQARVELARGEALSTGKVTIAENNMVAEVDFGVPDEHFESAGTPWSDPSADLLGDIRDWVDIYSETTDGVEPGAILTSRKVINNALRNEALRALAGSILGTPSFVTEGQLGQILAAHGLPPLIANNTRVRVDGTSQRVIPDHLAIFLPPAGETLGQTLWGVTAEALELAGEGLIESTTAPGIVAVVTKSTDPVRTWTLGTGISIPVIANPELLFVAEVIAEAV